MVDESEIFVEAHEIMLDAIMSLVQGMDEEDKKSFATTCAAPIIDSFIHCHLSPPDGIRKLSSNGKPTKLYLCCIFSIKYYIVLY